MLGLSPSIVAMGLRPAAASDNLSTSTSSARLKVGYFDGLEHGAWFYSEHLSCQRIRLEVDDLEKDVKFWTDALGAKIQR